MIKPARGADGDNFHAMLTGSGAAGQRDKDADACEHSLRTEPFPSMRDMPESAAPARRAVTR